MNRKSFLLKTLLAPVAGVFVSSGNAKSITEPIKGKVVQPEWDDMGVLRDALFFSFYKSIYSKIATIAVHDTDTIVLGFNPFGKGEVTFKFDATEFVQFRYKVGRKAAGEEADLMDFENRLIKGK